MDNQPFVTVIAPCRNEIDFIESTIESILSGDYPADKMELFVIDGMSDDGTREKVVELSKVDSRIRLIDNPEKIVPCAMNIGIKEAKGEYIVRIDCHCLFSSDYVSKCVDLAIRTGADNVGGYMETKEGADTETAKAIAAATTSKFGVGNSAFRVGGQECEVDTVPFGTFRKDIFDKVGFYDERLVRNQDIELNTRISNSGGKIIISPAIKLIYYNRTTYKGLWQQSFNNGLWNPYTIWLVGGGLRLRHFIPMFFVLSILVLGTLSAFHYFIGILLGSDILLYSIAALLFAIESGRKKKVAIFRVLISFFVLHIAYGFGSLWGILTIPFKFPKRNIKSAGKALSDRI